MTMTIWLTDTAVSSSSAPPCSRPCSALRAPAVVVVSREDNPLVAEREDHPTRKNSVELVLAGERVVAVGGSARGEG